MHNFMIFGAGVFLQRDRLLRGPYYKILYYSSPGL